MDDASKFFFEVAPASALFAFWLTTRAARYIYKLTYTKRARDVQKEVWQEFDATEKNEGADARLGSILIIIIFSPFIFGVLFFAFLFAVGMLTFALGDVRAIIEMMQGV